METRTQPSKEQVRTWFNKQVQSKTPPPTPAEIRRQLGWNLKEKRKS